MPPQFGYRITDPRKSEAYTYTWDRNWVTPVYSSLSISISSSPADIDVANIISINQTHVSVFTRNNSIEGDYTITISFTTEYGITSDLVFVVTFINKFADRVNFAPFFNPALENLTIYTGDIITDKLPDVKDPAFYPPMTMDVTYQGGYDFPKFFKFDSATKVYRLAPIKDDIGSYFIEITLTNGLSLTRLVLFRIRVEERPIE